MGLILKTFIFVLFCNVVLAQTLQNKTNFDYKRSSLYSVLINNTQQKYSKEIAQVFANMPTPDKYNNHDLEIKTVDGVLGKSAFGVSNDFLASNNIASRLVDKWYNRDSKTGRCDMSLIAQRGLYDAREIEKAIAQMSSLGMANIKDAGEQLIANTFVLMNDVEYVDHSYKGKTLGLALYLAGAITSAATGEEIYSDIGQIAAVTAGSLKGFRVKITTYLYKLEWNDTIQAKFNTQWYSDRDDIEKVRSYEENRSQFSLKYIGCQISKANDISVVGVNLEHPQMMIRKACQRSLDENISDLQKNFEEFRVKVPLLSTEPLAADIGLKDGVSKRSKYEVLEIYEDGGETKYKRVGKIVPQKDKIWDNRYMSLEENAKNSNLGKTYFKKKRKGKFYPGMLIREIR